MDTMLNLAIAHLNARGLEYVPIIDGWGDRRGFIIRTDAGVAVRVDTLDSEVHLRVRPADVYGHAAGPLALEVHGASSYLVGVAIDAIATVVHTEEGNL